MALQPAAHRQRRRATMHTAHHTDAAQGRPRTGSFNITHSSIMKRILGLDLGPNSIGWAVVEKDETDGTGTAQGSIAGAGSRIIPMDAATQGDFDKGNSVSQTKERTQYRSQRRLRERHQLRRERLNRVLDVMGFLPTHYSDGLDRYGKFKDADGRKIAWREEPDGSRTFLFAGAYAEMLADFRREQPEWLAGGARVPYDWTIYYLRSKAVSRPITKEELAWVVLNFNAKRGYYQLRGEDEDGDTQVSEEYLALKVVAVNDTGEHKGGNTWYDIVLDNGMACRRCLPRKPDLTGQVRDFIVTTRLDKDGAPRLDAKGNVARSVRMPGEDDWQLLKKKTEADIDRAHTTVGQYVYSALLANPKQKVRGRLVRTIERKYYKDELRRILDKQAEFMPELRDAGLYDACLRELYGSNEAYRRSVAGRGFTYLLADNIIFYQRPLKSKRSLIADCPYEYHTYTDKATGEERRAGVKCVAKSNPLYQEFRLWQFVSNLRLYEREKTVGGILRTDVDVTGELLPDDNARAALFDWLNGLESVTEERLLKDFIKCSKPRGKDAAYPYRWNYAEDKPYPCNETRGLMLRLLRKAGVPEGFLTPDVETALWHILYSVGDKQELKAALDNFAARHGLGAGFAAVFAKCPPFPKEYGAYSEKAIKRLLPLMRTGSRWSAAAIDPKTAERIGKLIDGEHDEGIDIRVREKLQGLTDISQYRGLPLWAACYVVYGRHSESADTSRWTSPGDIDRYLGSFTRHSLRNPIVEQTVLETLRTVRDIWRRYGRPDEIHIEMGRNMKQTAEQRRKATMRNLANENTNQRIRALLAEFADPGYGIPGVRPYSPVQQQLLRIYEDGALSRAGEMPPDIRETMRKLGETTTGRQPTRQEVMRYRLWLDQKYQSPYTGRIIPLARLFTTDYQIEHIIPQSRYFDDSLSNKVVCESAVNALKDRMLGLEFIKQMHGRVVELGDGMTATILGVEEYEQLVKTQYKGNAAKMRKLLMDDIPDDFINRQLNDSRYISRLVKALMSNIVREEGEQEATSRNVIACNGAITDRLKHDWGMDNVWNRLIMPRFRRLNAINGTDRFTATSASGHMIPAMPPELQKGFSKKRIDHRHHAMDAIVIACTTRDHVNLLNNEAAKAANNANRRQLSRKLRRHEQVTLIRNGETKTISVAREFTMPWPTFNADTERALASVIVSFKQNLRILGKTSNRYQHFVSGKKRLVAQTRGCNHAIRKPLHKDTVFGEINRRLVCEVQLNVAMASPGAIVDKDIKAKIKQLIALGYNESMIKAYFEQNANEWHDFNPKKIKVYRMSKDITDKQGNVKSRFFATRKPLDQSFNRKTIEGSIDDSGIRQILLRHLEACGDNPETAFSPEGIEEMNRNMTALNNGRPHQPIYKVRIFEKAEKFAVGKRGNKAAKFVEAAKGTNLFFAVYETEVTETATGTTTRKRTFSTIPLHDAIERRLAGMPIASPDANGNEAAFILSPNDLVYLPTADEARSGVTARPLDNERIYKMVSSNKQQCFFIKYNVACAIVDKNEFSSLNKMERAVTGEMIKETCIPIKVDRLGHITSINGKPYD